MNVDGGAGHELVDHTSEVELRLRAPTMRGLFHEAALGLAEVMAGQPVAASGDAHEAVQVESTDVDALLVDWVNELLFRAEVSGRLYPAVRIDRLTDRQVVGAIGAVELPTPRHDVKAATMHGVRIAPVPGGFAANVILDV